MSLTLIDQLAEAAEVLHMTRILFAFSDRASRTLARTHGNVASAVADGRDDEPAACSNDALGRLSLGNCCSSTSRNSAESDASAIA